MRPFFSLLRQFKRNEQGGIYILFGAGLLLLMAGMALTVDVGGTYVRHSNLQQGLRNATQEPAKELVYMWLRCKTGAGERPRNILPRCVGDDAALAQLRTYMQNYVQSNVPDSVQVTVNEPSIRRTPQGVFLYTTATFQMTRFFRFWDQTPKPVTVESNRLLVDLTPNSELQPAIYAIADASNQSNRNQMNDAINNALTALNELGYTINPRCGAHLYGQGSQMPNGGGCGAKDASGIWTGQCATGDAAMEHRIGPLYGRFSTQMTRLCPTPAQWTGDVRNSPGDTLGVNACRTFIGRPSCTNGDICGYDNHSDEYLCVGACSCNAGFTATTCGGQPCCKREWTTPRSCCHACSGWSVSTCNRCDRNSDWHNLPESLGCWRREPYKETVYYHTCSMPMAREDIDPTIFVDLNDNPVGYSTKIHRDAKDILEFSACYVGNNATGPCVDVVERLVGTVVTSIPGGNESLPVENELLSLMTANTRNVWVWECGQPTIWINDPDLPLGGINTFSRPYGGKDYYTPPPLRDANCVGSVRPPLTRYVEFKPANCDMATYRGCEIKEGYWKIFAKVKDDTPLIGRKTAPTRTEAWELYDDLSNPKIYRVSQEFPPPPNGVRNNRIPGPHSTGICNASLGRCATPGPVFECNNVYATDQGTIGGRFGPHVFATPEYVPEEILYLSSFSIETARPNDTIVGKMLDTFSPSAGSLQRIFTSKDLTSLSTLRYTNEVSLQNGVLALNWNDNDKEIPIGVTTTGVHEGVRVQSIHTVYAPDGLTPATNAVMGAGLGQCQAVITQPTNQTPAIDPSASCDAVERGARILLDAVSGTNRIPVLIAGVTCPQNTCATSYRGAQAPFGHQENKNYDFSIGSKRMPNMGCNSGFNYQSQTGACMVAAVSALRNRGIVFPYHLGGANTCQPELLQMSTDANNENAVGDHICIPGAGCTSGDAAADIAFAIVMASRQVGRETAQGEADMYP